MGVPAAHVIGHSFGGTLARNFAIHHPGRVATLTLIEPVRTFSGVSTGIILSSIPSQLPFSPRAGAMRDAALAYIGGAEVDGVGADPVSRMIAPGTGHCRVRRTVPKIPDAARLTALAMPVAVHLGEESTVTQPRKQIR